MRDIDEWIAVRPGAASPLHIEEEEGLGIAHRREFAERDRAADISAELIETKFLFGVVERITRIERVIAQEFIGRPVELSPSAPGRRRDENSGIPPVLGIEIAALNLELAD